MRGAPGGERAFAVARLRVAGSGRIDGPAPGVERGGGSADRGAGVVAGRRRAGVLRPGRAPAQRRVSRRAAAPGAVDAGGDGGAGGVRSDRVGRGRGGTAGVQNCELDDVEAAQARAAGSGAARVPGGDLGGAGGVGAGGRGADVLRDCGARLARLPSVFLAARGLALLGDGAGAAGSRGLGSGMAAGLDSPARELRDGDREFLDACAGGVFVVRRRAGGAVLAYGGRGSGRGAEAAGGAGASGLKTEDLFGFFTVP